MSVNVYVRITKLPDVCGRIDYISNPKRQEHLHAVASTVADNPTFWSDLAREGREAWVLSGAASRTHMVKKVDSNSGEVTELRKENQCCEARELQGDLPNGALDMDLHAVAKRLADDFKKAFSSDCIVAIHQNKTCTNLHYHLIHSERSLLPEPAVRKAGNRAVFIDERGVRCRTKNELLDESGCIRPGCRIVPKGEIISIRRFGEKEDLFSKNSWREDIKRWMAEWINENLQPDEQRTVFDPLGPRLPQMHVGKGRSKEQQKQIEQYNRIVKSVNGMISDGTIDQEEAMAIKGYVMMSPNRGEALKDLFDLNGAELLRNERTRNQGEIETIKKRLREEYRLAAKARGEAYETKDSVQRNIAMAEARQHSMRIDRLRIELRIKQSEYEQEKRYWEEMRRRDNCAQYWKKRQEIASCDSRIDWLYDQISYLKKRQYELGFFEFSEYLSLEYEIESIRKQIDDEYRERASLQWSKSVLKDMMKQDQKDRREEKKNDKIKNQLKEKESQNKER